MKIRMLLNVNSDEFFIFNIIDNLCSILIRATLTIKYTSNDVLGKILYYSKIPKHKMHHVLSLKIIKMICKHRPKMIFYGIITIKYDAKHWKKFNNINS